MSSVLPIEVVVDDDAAGAVLSVLRKVIEGSSWKDVRRLLNTRRVSLNGVLCLDEGRKVAAGEVIQVHVDSLPVPPSDKDVVIRWLDQSLVVVEKPSGMLTLRRSTEKNWRPQRKLLQPTLDECVARLVDAKYVRSRSESDSELHSVHRIDRDTSGLLVFARNENVQYKLIEQFAAHDAVRRYLSLIPGSIEDQSVRSCFIRDRGDGLRGSSPDGRTGQHAVTHFRTLRSLGALSELECSLETGRTNQIRIHLAELGHPVCGDIKYRGPMGSEPVKDESGVPRLALHATQLRFVHPVTGELLHFESPWPMDMQRFLNRIPSVST
ncbi:MAG: hypothetical protein KDA91_02340 [Planctomycetaceae bacterium]|nr:hypothetical protein [Planctomycetaceae bacterium]